MKSIAPLVVVEDELGRLWLYIRCEDGTLCRVLVEQVAKVPK